MTSNKRIERADELERNAAPERAVDWDQLGLPIAMLRTDGSLLHVNRSFKLLMGSARQLPLVSGLDWLACLAADSRVALFTALADRRTVAGPLAWIGGRDGGPRWFSVTLRWRPEQGFCYVTWQDVTALHQAEWAAQRQAGDLRALMHSTPVMLASFDVESMRCLFANRTFAQTFELEESTLLGCTLGELVGEDLAQLCDPALDQVRRTLRPTEFDHELMPNRSAPRRVEVRLLPQFDTASQLDRIVLQLTDVTRQRDGERALRESEERLARFMRGSVEGMVFHEAGIVADANPAFCALLGLGLHDIIGRPLEAFLEPAATQGDGALTAELSDDANRVERSLLHRDGSSVPVEWIDLVNPGDAPPSVALEAGLRMTAVRDLRDHKAAQARAHFLAHHDAVTGLPNRQAFLAQLDHLMVAARSAGTSLGLLFIDLDDFKRVNDSVGHAAADAHLRTLAQRVGAHVRSTDRVARFGGDEFMVLLPGVRESGDVLSVAHKLIAALAEPIEIEGRPISVTPSIGVALYPRDADTPDLLIKQADTAMHVAKSRGRASVTVYEPAQGISAYDKMVLEGELGHAVEQGEFTLLFQPQVCARTGRPHGVEALIRWHHPERGLLKPDDFIGLAEQHRLMLPIGRWVLEEAARATVSWRQAGLMPLTMAVNLSALQFQAPDFLDAIEDLLAHTALPPGWLELEITERMLMDDLAAVRERLHWLRSRGVRISVDDFGTGHSSLAHLRDLPIDCMKIDRSFVRDLPADPASVAITGAIIQLAQGLGLSVVGEGVETLAQQRCLSELRCDQLQGLLVCAPLPADELAEWLAQWPGQAALQWGITDVGTWSEAH